MLTCIVTPPPRVDAPLTPRHRRRLAELFPIWEVRNGSRAPELNMPAAIYIETHGGTGIGGSDDHAGVDIGRTFTEVPAMALATRALVLPGSGAPYEPVGCKRRTATVDPATVLKIAQRTISEGAAREGRGW